MSNSEGLSAPIDTVITAETPEGIEIPIRPAGFPVRCCAFLIDVLLQAVTIGAFSAALNAAGAFGAGMLFIVVFAVNWFYPVLFELMAGAATPGKRILGLQVMMVDGLPITPAGSLIRNLMRVVDMMPAMYAFGIIALLVRSDARRLGDLAAGTVVVYRGAREQSSFAAGLPQAPRVALSERQQRALAAFATRVERLTPERAEEIAGIAATRIRPSDAADAAPAGPKPLTTYLVSVARWLNGERPPSHDAL